MSNGLLSEYLQLRDQLTDLLEQAHRNQQIMRRNQMLDLKFIGADSFRELIDSIFQTFTESSELDVVTLLLLDPEYDIRRILVNLNIDYREFPNLLFLQNETELGELHGRLQKPVLGPYSEQMYGPMFPDPMITPVSVAIVPLLRNDRLIGCLSLGSSREKRFADNMATDFIEHRASIVAICIENVINKELLKHIGMTDPLTRVNNRRYVEHRLLEEIGRSHRQGYALSCMYIDIDHFKKINDKVGHQAGDEVLREVAARIKAELRLNDALGRFGGEEFLVLLSDAELVDATGVAERIRAGIAEQPFTLNSGAKLSVTVSIGIATLIEPDRTDAIETIAQKFVARADQALYQAKAGGRNKVVSID
ncbi:MAG TPA: sensor domain-containing diguanylate cyclase [Burkholderiaceae bacterium]|jgi:diguanylate cyclase (GGDEF)-like protein|nr:sensor domain-containing diguanylate cyclase [Burkholderiaceae bacterium]